MYRSALVAASLAALALTGCNGGASPAQQAKPALSRARHAGSTPSTIYVLNRQVGKKAGWVSAYSAAGATLDRKFGDVGSGPGVDNYPGIAAGASGHLYLYTALNLGQILVYKKYGAVLQQTLQYQNKIPQCVNPRRFRKSLCDG